MKAMTASKPSLCGDSGLGINRTSNEFGWSAEPTAYLYRVSGTPTTDALRKASGQFLELGDRSP